MINFYKINNSYIKNKKYIFGYNEINKKKKYLLIALAFLVLIIPVLFTIGSVYAEEGEEEIALEQQLEESIYEQLKGLDLSSVEGILANFTTAEYSIFGSNSFFEKVYRLISGDFAEGQTSVFSAILNLIFDDLLNYLPVIATIIAITIICGFISQLRGNEGSSSKSVGDIIHFVCFGIIITIILSSVVSIVNMTTQTLQILKAQIDIIFPILLTILTAMGGVVSVSVYQPAVALLSGTIMQIFISILMPIFMFSFVFSIVSNLTSTVKLEKFTNFFNSAFKWIIGGVFTVFTAFMSIQGITASSYDGVSIRTAKYAIRSYVPILGGYLSEGFDIIMASSVLIKNAVGASGLLLMFATIILPLVKIIIFMLCLKLASAVLEPIADNRISNFIHSVSKSMVMLIVMIVGVSFMYLISVGLIMCTSNFV